MTEQIELMDFYADWCGPCRIMKPILEELEQEYGAKVKLTKIDVDQNPDLANQYQVRSIPTLIFRKGEQVVDQLIGAVPKESLKKKIDGLLN